MKKLFLLLVASLVFLGCSSDDNSMVDTDNPSGGDSIITPTEDSTSYFSDGINFTSKQEGVIVSFTTNKNWTVSVANIPNSETWCTISPIISGKAGDASFQVNVSEHMGYDDRSVVLTIKAGNLEKKIMVTQKQKDAILLTSNRIEVKQQGGMVNLEVKANITYSIEIDEISKDWIKQKGSQDTRSLTSSNLVFEISPNEKYEKREGEIIFINGDITETVRIYQNGGGIIVLTKNEYPIGNNGGTIQIEINSNCEFETKMPSVDWVTEAPDTKNMSSHTKYYVINPNDTYDNRDAKIIYYDKNDKTRADTLTILQAQKNAIIISNKEYSIEQNGGIIEIELNTNVDYDILISDSYKWIKQTQSSSTRALINNKLHFSIDTNESYGNRTGVIIIRDKTSYLSEVISIYQSGLKNRVIVELKSAGTLSNYIEQSKKYDITDLVIRGNLNGSDILYIREMAGRTGNGNLSTLDISETNIVSGGTSYYSSSSSPYYTYNDVIGIYMFTETKLESIILPNSVKMIGGSAFSKCTELTSIIIPNSVTAIGSNAFSSCIRLASIEMPNSIATIGEYAFNGCTSLNSINIPNSVTSIERRLFNDCKKISSIIMSSGVATIGEYAFSGCTNLNNIDIPSSVTSIGNYAFNNTNLISIAIPNSVTKINSQPFNQCTNLKNINVAIDNPNYSSINGVLFNKEKTHLINYPIDNDAVYSIPNGVTNIENKAFSGCINLTTITIPNSVISISQYGAFNGCVNLKKIYCKSIIPIDIQEGNVFENVPIKSCELYVPKGSYDLYWNAPIWCEFKNIIEE